MSENTVKCCSVCQSEKPGSDFSPDSRARDGLQSRCKPCGRAAKSAKYHADAEASRRKCREKYARNPAGILASSAAYRTRNTASVAASKAAYYERNRVKLLAKAAAYAATNKEQKAVYDRHYRRIAGPAIEENKKAWRAKNTLLVRMIRAGYKARRRAAEKAGDSARDIATWAASQPKVCRWCQVDCSEEYELDHIQALALGGAHRIANLCIACPPCNRRKNAKTVEEFLRHRTEAA